MIRKDVIIIGGGPAGLTAGLYAARAFMDVLLIRSGIPVCQATMTNDIENYPGFPEGIGGPELVQRMEDQARRFGLQIVEDGVESVTKAEGGFIIKTAGTSFEARTVVVATGAVPRPLGTAGEAKYRGRGVSYCATCDGRFFVDMPIAVVGGGDAAVKEAIYLTRFASKIYLVHRRQGFRAEPVIVREAASNPKIKFVLDSIVTEIQGDNLVKAVTVRNVVTREEKHIPVEGVFIFTGIQPNSELVSRLVDTDERGFILTDRNMSTSCPGIYAAGDVCQKDLRQIVTAVSDGAVAIDAIEKYLSDSQIPNNRVPARG